MIERSNSGGSEYPHMHIAAYDHTQDENDDHCVDMVPYEFTEAWQ